MSEGFPVADPKPFAPNHLVKIKAGKYAGRLARVVSVGLAGELVNVRLNSDLNHFRRYHVFELENLGEFGGARS